MKNKILSMISFITVFVPVTMLFVWKPTAPNATAIAIGYCVFVAISFFYALFLFCKQHLRDIYVKIGLGINALYLLGILVLIVLPRLL